MTAKIIKILFKTGLVKGPAASALEGAADLAENQASMEGNATLGDRLRQGGIYYIICNITKKIYSD